MGKLQPTKLSNYQNAKVKNSNFYIQSFAPVSQKKKKKSFAPNFLGKQTAKRECESHTQTVNLIHKRIVQSDLSPQPHQPQLPILKPHRNP